MFSSLQLPSFLFSSRAIACAAAIAFAALVRWLCCARPSRAFGAGENARWSRNIRMDRPSHESKHHRLEQVWEYTGRRPSPAAALPGSGPVTGHTLGRQTWSPVVAGSPRAAAAAAAQASSSGRAFPSAACA